MYPGQSTLNGDIVYCDNNSVMWSPTLDKDGKVGGAAKTYAWGPETCLPDYAKGNCNNLKDKDIVDYPACQACRNLDYAGFSEGWYLPSQSNGNLTEYSGCKYCCLGSTSSMYCGYSAEGQYCAPGRQLWDFGAEQCSNWKSSGAVCAASQGQCLPSYDNQAQSSTYWSSTQHSAAGAWRVGFGSARASYGPRSVERYVRCVLGNYNK